MSRYENWIYPQHNCHKISVLCFNNVFHPFLFRSVTFYCSSSKPANNCPSNCSDNISAHIVATDGRAHDSTCYCPCATADACGTGHIDFPGAYDYS